MRQAVAEMASDSDVALDLPGSGGAHNLNANGARDLLRESHEP
jgi:hypothetical protein